MNVELDRMELDLLAQVRSFHRGRERAVTREELAGVLGRPPMRLIRKARERLVSAGYPIGVNEGGYFYCVDRADFRASRAYTMKKVRGFLRQARRERWAWEAEGQRMERGRAAEQMELIPCVEVAR